MGRYTHISPYSRQCWADVRVHVQRKRKNELKITRRLKLNFYLPNMPRRLHRESKPLKKELLAPDPGRSRVGELNPRRKDQNRS